MWVEHPDLPGQKVQMARPRNGWQETKAPKPPRARKKPSREAGTTPNHTNTEE